MRRAIAALSALLLPLPLQLFVPPPLPTLQNGCAQGRRRDALRRTLACDPLAGSSDLHGRGKVSNVLWQQWLHQRAGCGRCVFNRCSRAAAHVTGGCARRSFAEAGQGGSKTLQVASSEAARAPTNAADVDDVGKDGEVIVVKPQGDCHTCTLVYLHGYARRAGDYLPKGCMGFPFPWNSGGDRAPGLRTVLPMAAFMKQPWGDVARSWYSYTEPHRNHCGNVSTLLKTRETLRHILEQEIALLDGASERVYLGGSSQGCTSALDVYLREASRLHLGGFVGSVGFIPRDSLGFKGANAALESLLSDTEQAARPVWMQCATDDRRDVPWRNLVAPLLHLVEGKLPGFAVRLVEGRGHGIQEWEAHIVNDFLKRYVQDAYRW